jgi:hypothetical protein
VGRYFLFPLKEGFKLASGIYCNGAWAHGRMISIGLATQRRGHWHGLKPKRQQALRRLQTLRASASRTGTSGLLVSSLKSETLGEV